MLLNIIIAAFMIVVTSVVHASGMILVLKAIRSQEGNLYKAIRQKQIIWTCGIVLLMAIVSLVEVMIWASAYLALNAIDGFEQALYFSMVTFTSLGYGDIVLEENCRLLAAFEAVNGVIMFGWTTAIVVAAVQHIFFNIEPHNRKIKKDKK
jgi:hypothetical protein